MPGDEGKVMIAGGQGSTGIYRSVYMLDMVTGRYTDLASMHTSRWGLQLVRAGDQIFAIGGGNSGSANDQAKMHSMRLCNFITCLGQLITV
jgi:hypothetical protein